MSIPPPPGPSNLPPTSPSPPPVPPSSPPTPPSSPPTPPGLPPTPRLSPQNKPNQSPLVSPTTLNIPLTPSVFQPSSPIYHSEHPFENGSIFSFKHFDSPRANVDMEVPPLVSPGVNDGSDSTSSAEAPQPQVLHIYHQQMDGK